MSARAPIQQLTPPDVAARKGDTPLVCLPACTTPIARISDAECDVLLVVAMVLHGLFRAIFVRRCPEMEEAAARAVARYAAAVRARRCPWPDHVFPVRAAR
ncbi:hypothetical protein [uncultured Paracoccus sp.]|uniref:hypothetical protein n=1 Tax=uncultured Paracoccus sp. TaxID=189685 RepID=UPI0034596B86